MSVFASFWQAGYEGADHVTRNGDALWMAAANGHQHKTVEDYQALAAFGITTVRESVGWRLCETRHGYDFSSVKQRMVAAHAMGIQVCWTIQHYGFPTDIELMSEAFISRFAAFSGALARFLAPFYDRPPVYSPVNEISFTSWAMAVGFFPTGIPDSLRDGYAIKCQLVRATIAACDAIWQADPRARILHCDPIINIVPPETGDFSSEAVWGHGQAQYQAWDMLCGRLEPDLGGAPHYLDLIGANYYHDNQWEFGSNRRLWWHLGDSRRRPLHLMLADLYQRYNRPLLLAETSHVGSGRGAWINHITQQSAQALLNGIELNGICLYPIIDRPDWENSDVWNHSGLWDVTRHKEVLYERVLDGCYANALRKAQAWLHHFHPLCSLSGHDKDIKMKLPLLLVFSHLRWDFVFQRPQHLLTSLASCYRVLFIEEPVFQEGEAGLHLSYPAANVTVARPHTEVSKPGFHDDQITLLQPLIEACCADDDEIIVWFYTPMALPLLSAVKPALIIYDCMDELAAFDHAPRQLLQRESALLSSADLVFTGGPSLYEAKKGRHASVHCFPSSVDTVHFEQALDRSNDHPLQEAIPHPRLGYYGVIDERMDTVLIGELAAAHPEWHFIYVGPVVKIDPASLPRAENIHYFGQQPYQALPQFLAGWDVCLMPFMLNESTRFISPTKVLEYMAAEHPVVSTAITDVVQPYGDLVFIANDRRDFIRCCEQALALPSDAYEMMQKRMRARVSVTSWASTAEKMKALIDQAAVINKPVPAKRALMAGKVIDYFNSSDEPPQSAKYLILGAGPTGLSAAWHLGKDALLLERNPEVGGWCRSVTDHGFTFDYAGHIMFSADPYVLEMYELLLADNIHWQTREAWVYSQDTFTRYPFQGALYGLPAPVIKECILGAIEARYETPTGKGATTRLVKPLSDCCADGTVPDNSDCTLTSRDKEAENFEQFIYHTWGRGIAKYFAVPYNQKLWKVPLNEMETSWLGGRVPLPDLAQIIEGALEPVAKPVGPNARFAYPLKGGFQALMAGFLPHLKGTVETDAEIVQLFPEQHQVVLADGRRYRYEQLISTLPLPALIKMIGAFAPEAIHEAAERLRFTSIRCVNLGIGRANLTDKHWVYYPDETIFHRLFMQGNASPHCNPENGFGLTCEISYTEDQPLPVEGDALIQRCIDDCIRVGLFNAEDKVITANQTDIPCAYVIYDHQRQQNVDLIRNWLIQYDITLSGRYSEWEYYNSDHAFLAGKKAAEKLIAQAPKRDTAF